VEAVVGFLHIMKYINRTGFHNIIEGYWLSSITKSVEPFEGRLYYIN